jgi:hypothetical protein
MRALTIRRGIVVSLGLVATLSMAACTSNTSPSNAGSGNTHTAAPAASSTTTTHPAVTPSATPAAPRAVQNLFISSAERNSLTAAFIALKGISPSDVGGTFPGSVYYAYDPATDTYWARAEFMPSRMASLPVQVSFQDGDGVGMFKKTGAGPWQAQLVGSVPFSCNEVKFFPPAVLTAWGMPTSVPAGLQC